MWGKIIRLGRCGLIRFGIIKQVGAMRDTWLMDLVVNRTRGRVIR